MTDAAQFYLDLIRYLALPADEQVKYFGDTVPLQSSHQAGEWTEGKNGLVDLLRFVADIGGSRDLEGDREREEELQELVKLMLASHNVKLWNRGAVETNPAWRRDFISRRPSARRLILRFPR